MTSTVLSHDPKIILQDSFISIEDCNHIIEQSKSSLQQSVVANQKGPGISNGRNADSIPDSKVGISSEQPKIPSSKEASPKIETMSINVSSRS